ncbi:MAG TPA: hypothetical protein VN039_07435, partial [Nitrospira sp.]|nr:hypothetical protein [Nitrospira sp.]
GIAKPEQHWSFNWVECCDGPCDVQCGNRHPCPEYLRSIPGAWDQYVKDWTAAKQDELQRMGKAPAPAPGIDWSKFHKPVPIPALSKTDVNKNDTAPGIQSSEGTDFVFISDVLEPLEDVDRLAVGDRSSAKTGPKIAKGERFLAAWLFKAISGPDKDCYFALTPAPFWTRVNYRDAEGKMYVKRVADAPLKGTP